MTVSSMKLLELSMDTMSKAYKGLKDKAIDSAGTAMKTYQAATQSRSKWLSRVGELHTKDSEEYKKRASALRDKAFKLISKRKQVTKESRASLGNLLELSQATYARASHAALKNYISAADPETKRKAARQVVRFNSGFKTAGPANRFKVAHDTKPILSPQRKINLGRAAVLGLVGYGLYRRSKNTAEQRTEVQESYPKTGAAIKSRALYGKYGSARNPVMESTDRYFARLREGQDKSSPDKDAHKYDKYRLALDIAKATGVTDAVGNALKSQPRRSNAWKGLKKGAAVGAGIAAASPFAMAGVDTAANIASMGYDKWKKDVIPARALAAQYGGIALRHAPKVIGGAALIGGLHGLMRKPNPAPTKTKELTK